MTEQIAPTELKYVCFHEAGHAAITYAVGGTVEFIEILDSNGNARARTRANRPAEVRKQIAAGGFAIEYLLFRAGRVVGEDRELLSEKNFIDASMNNSSEDKVAFFGSDEMQSDGKWPEEHDREYMTFAIKNVVPLLGPQLTKIEELANALESQGRVDREQLERILGCSP